MLLGDILVANQIKIPVQAVEKSAVIAELMDVIGHKINDKELLYKAVLEREKIMTTGVGNGIAIPHCKSPACPQFVIALGISPAGIEFNAVDSKKVNLIFLLLGPEDAPNIHIKLLSRISRIMNNGALRRQLIDCASGKQAYELIQNAEMNFQEA
jgi:mannitol/fructose-specific phosphotransferase system IIA component (Ntr-type)